MPLYDYFTPKLDFKRKFNHRQSFLYKGRLTVRTIFESDHHYESNPESEVRFEIESNLEASQVPNNNRQSEEYCSTTILWKVKAYTPHTHSLPVNDV